jgi:hypothetical protein
LPGLTTESDARLQAALAASARAEASLNGLFRSIQSLGSGVGGAREANDSLTHELEALRDMLGAASEQQLAFKQKVALLEQALDRARKETERDRAFLIEQQDAFLVILIDEQEAELRRRDSDLETLRGRVAELEQRDPIVKIREPIAAPRVITPSQVATVAPPRPEGITLTSAASVTPPSTDMDRAERAELERTAQKLAEDRERARETVQRLQAQRDEAQAAVARITKDRDEALQQVHRLKAELGGPRISTRPPSAESRRDSASFRVASQPGDILTLEGLELEARLARPVSSSQPTLPAASSADPSLPHQSSSKLSAAPISSVLNPPRSNPATSSPLPTRLSPPPTRLSPPPNRLSPPPAGRNSQPPEELRRALTNPPASSPTSSKPVLKQKPDPSTRPLVGYSMGTESVETEHVRLSSKPPRGDKR